MYDLLLTSILGICGSDASVAYPLPYSKHPGGRDNTARARNGHIQDGGRLPPLHVGRECAGGRRWQLLLVLPIPYWEEGGGEGECTRITRLHHNGRPCARLTPESSWGRLADAPALERGASRLTLEHAEGRREKGPLKRWWRC
jgi:hypothetical protein